MRFPGLLLAAAATFVGHAFAQAPTVGGLLNNYSFTLPGLPNYGIAQGSIFDIFGTNLAGQTTPLQNPPLQSTLNGVTINVTVSGVTTHPLFYFQSSIQIDAILPSTTPVGTGTITVTTSAGTSPEFPIQVVASGFGLLTKNNGAGPVVGYDANNNHELISYSAATNPGDTLELWGTGLGPVADDAPSVSITTPIEVDIGGIPATVTYHGRSSYAGLDQVNVVVPDGVSGCNVSVVVISGGYVSNYGTLPVAPSGRTCSDPLNPLSSDITDKVNTSGSFSGGVIVLNKSTTPGTTIGGVTVGGGTVDSGSAIFSKITAAQFNAGGYTAAAGGYSSIGSCIVNFFSSTGGSSAPPPAFQVTYLNAGPNINITGPDGTIAMPLQTVNDITLYGTPATATSFIPDSGGAFAFDNASGGPDVGAFTAQLQLATPLNWSNKDSISTVDRTQGVTVNWTGGDPDTYVNITGLSFGSVDGSDSNFVAGYFSCQAPVAAGTFTVPSPVLLSLPASYTITAGGITVSTSSLSLLNITSPVTFTAPGLDVGLIEAIVENTITVTYQ